VAPQLRAIEHSGSIDTPSPEEVFEMTTAELQVIDQALKIIENADKRSTSV
jgi:hypothetical protein